MLTKAINKIPILRNYIVNRPTLQKVIDNISWLFLDKILRMGIGLFVMGWVARYLGPEQFGLWNYAIAFTSLFGAFATLGLDGIVVRELVKHPERTGELLGTAFVLRIIGATIAFTLSIGGVLILGNTDTLTLSLIALSAAGFIFQAFLAIDYYYQANIMSKYTVWSQNIAFLIMSVAKIILILNKAPLIGFAVAGLMEIIIASAFLVFFFLFKKSPIYSTSSSNALFQLSLKNYFQFSSKTAKSLLKDSWSLILSGIAIMIYMRIDQVMIKEMLGDREVGLYSAAVRISEVWYFIPMAIASSVFPKIVEYKKISEELYYKRLQSLFLFMSWLGIGVGVIITFFGETIIKILFGIGYSGSIDVLIIHAWSGIFVCLGVASSGWYIAEGLTRMSLYRTVLGSFSNVILNLIMIPKFSITGAAISTLLSYAMAGYIADFFSYKTKRIFFLKTKSFFPFFLWR